MFILLVLFVIWSDHKFSDFWLSCWCCHKNEFCLNFWQFISLTYLEFEINAFYHINNTLMIFSTFFVCNCFLNWTLSYFFAYHIWNANQLCGSFFVTCVIRKTKDILYKLFFILFSLETVWNYKVVLSFQIYCIGVILLIKRDNLQLILIFYH